MNDQKVIISMKEWNEYQEFRNRKEKAIRKIIEKYNELNEKYKEEQKLNTSITLQNIKLKSNFFNWLKYRKN